MIKRFCLFIPLFLFSFLLHAEEDLEAYLAHYAGRWVGHFTVHSAATGYSETFAVEQQYWWKDGELRGVAVTQREGGMESSRSCTYVKEGRLISEVGHGDKLEFFQGVFIDGGIVWVPADLKRANQYQMKESLKTNAEGARMLITEGFDTYVYSEGLAHLIYRGALEFQAEPVPDK